MQTEFVRYPVAYLGEGKEGGRKREGVHKKWMHALVPTSKFLLFEC